jgi:hypothetical protein
MFHVRLGYPETGGIDGHAFLPHLGLGKAALNGS